MEFQMIFPHIYLKCRLCVLRSGAHTKLLHPQQTHFSYSNTAAVRGILLKLFPGTRIDSFVSILASQNLIIVGFLGFYLFVCFLVLS